ncbi:uncharacterized protein LOC125944525 isoform X1 [Dermacentor silvarum]|uniref:uncharacterized protein LOC125944525 isoform X1 n=1 Tax=Dermacentor silvarum TaxID=543639 RepID=UPI002100A91E|nr:uncharacterized protein LOC125944525 isoform X1 [Dermacentor silvarum]
MNHICTSAFLHILCLTRSYGKHCPQKKCIQEWCPAVFDKNKNTYIGQGSRDGQYHTSCLKLWCPAVTRFSKNDWLCPSDLDPDMLTMTTTKQEPMTETNETPADREQTKPQDSEQDGGEQDKYKAFRDPSPYCIGKDGMEFPDGKGCVLEHTQDPNSGNPQCTLGVCDNGNCESTDRSTCQSP